MNHSGDAAEQIVRMSLEGVEVVAKITGSAAKEIAVFLMAALKSPKGKLKLKGKARLASMLRSGKALEIFSVRDSDLQKFVQGAKQYGIVYCVLRSKGQVSDEICDILVKADDAPKISRLAERFHFATVDRAKVESELNKGEAIKGRGDEQQTPDRNDTDKLLEKLLPDEGKIKQHENSAQKEVREQRNPETAKAAKPRLSEPILGSRSKSAGGTSSKPSVKGELRKTEAAQKKKADTLTRDERQRTDGSGITASVIPFQPRMKNGFKSKEPKERM
ncbi:MAG: PcfB family protein [Clostridiales Family XIII bacterium]|jgi:hypothetical protein|nr:PcfB family protein [Clostridiales Family XIII bacterium]